MEKREGRNPAPDESALVDQQAEQQKQTPKRPGGDIFVAHAENARPHAAESEEMMREDLWRTLIDARKAAGESMTRFGFRIGVAHSQVQVYESRGPMIKKLETLQRYVDNLTGAGDPIAGPAPLSPQEQAILEKQRRWAAAGKKLWQKRHPEKAAALNRAAQRRFSARRRENQAAKTPRETS
jgi:hypothetical protein